VKRAAEGGRGRHRCIVNDMGSVWRKLREWVRERMKIRVTWAGYAFTGAIGVTFAGALLSGNNLIFLIASVLISTALISGLVNKLSLAGLEVEFHPPEHLFAGEQTMAKIVVRNEKSWMPSFSTRLQSIHTDGLAQALYFAIIGGGEAVTEHAAVKFGRRGRFRDNSLQFTSRFPFGFTERRERVTLLADVVVYPALEPGALAVEFLDHVRGARLSRHAGVGDEFYRLRPYVPSDAAKRIDWRSTARHGEVHVRENTRDEMTAVTIVLDLFLGGAAMSWFESALSTVAWLAVELDREGVPFFLKTQQRTIDTPRDGDCYTVLRYLALVEPMPFDAADGLEQIVPIDSDSAVLVLTADPARNPVR